MGEKKRSSDRIVRPQVGIIMGSASDLPVMAEAAEVLEGFGVACEVTIVSAHRTPERMVRYAAAAEKRGLRVIIAGAGGAAHLPGMMAALTLLPVVGVPILSSNSIQGIDSLLSIVQMPSGTPVATVAVNGAKNAGFLAAQILAVSDSSLRQRLFAKRRQTRDSVERSVGEIGRMGFRAYLKKASIR